MALTPVRLLLSYDDVTLNSAISDTSDSRAPMTKMQASSTTHVVFLGHMRVEDVFISRSKILTENLLRVHLRTLFVLDFWLEVFLPNTIEKV